MGKRNDIAKALRDKGESPGQCEMCERIIHNGEKYGQCPDTEALTCCECLPDDIVEELRAEAVSDLDLAARAADEIEKLRSCLPYVEGETNG